MKYSSSEKPNQNTTPIARCVGDAVFLLAEGNVIGICLTPLEEIFYSFEIGTKADLKLFLHDCRAYLNLIHKYYKLFHWICQEKLAEAGAEILYQATFPCTSTEAKKQSVGIRDVKVDFRALL